MSDIFEEVVDRWTSNDAWQFASKEAAWGYFFMAGRESKQRENEMDPHIDGVVPVQMTDAERGFLNGMLIGNLRRIYAAHDDEGNDLSALPSRSADMIEQLSAENEALKQQVEQGKRDAVPEDIRKDAESWRFYKKRKDEVIAAGMGRKILRDAAAPKQEK